MSHTYAVQKTPKGWCLTVEAEPGKWFVKPTQLGVYRTKRAAVVTAQLLAGPGGRVVEFKNA